MGIDIDTAWKYTTTFARNNSLTWGGIMGLLAATIVVLVTILWANDMTTMETLFADICIIVFVFIVGLVALGYGDK